MQLKKHISNEGEKYQKRKAKKYLEKEELTKVMSTKRKSKNMTNKKIEKRLTEVENRMYICVCVYAGVHHVFV